MEVQFRPRQQLATLERVGSLFADDSCLARTDIMFITAKVIRKVSVGLHICCSRSCQGVFPDWRWHEWRETVPFWVWRGFRLEFGFAASFRLYSLGVTVECRLVGGSCRSGRYWTRTPVISESNMKTSNIMCPLSLLVCGMLSMPLPGLFRVLIQP